MAYTAPTPADLKAVHTEFAAVADVTVQFWIDRVNGRDVDESWCEADFAPAIEAAAAHRMDVAGVAGISGGAAGRYARAGVTRLKSGTVDVTLSDSVVAATSAGGWGSTPYGQDYLELLRRNKGGPGVTSVGGCCA